MAFSSLDEECSTIRFLRYRERLCFSWLVTIILINRHPTNRPTQHLGLEVKRQEWQNPPPDDITIVVCLYCIEKLH